MTLLSLDDRRRASFGRIGRKTDSLYEVTELPDGSLLLTPAVVVSTAEKDLLTGPAALREALVETLEGTGLSETRVSGKRPSSS
jgi:hypothetical protein